MPKDKILLKNGFFYHCQIKKFNLALIDETNVLSEFNKIDAKRINHIVLDSKRNRIIIKSDKDKELVLNLESENHLKDFTKEVLQVYPNSTFLKSDTVKLQLIKKPLWAMAVIICLLVIISFIDPKNSGTSGSLKSQGIMNLLRGFASLETQTLITIFGTLFLIPCLSIYIKLKLSKKVRIIQLVQ